LIGLDAPEKSDEDEEPLDIEDDDLPF